MSTTHPVFAKFAAYSGHVPEGFQADFSGAIMRCEFVAGSTSSGAQVGPPPVDEEYFEWIDVVESVEAAQDRYTMFELGAGYGRWAVRAACLLRQRGPIPFHVLAVEAEPQHFKWLRQHLTDNLIKPEECTSIQAVVSDQPGKRLFYVGMPQGGNDTAALWYGQAITKSYETPEKGDGIYEGYPVVKHKSGWRSIEVQSITLPYLLRDFDRVDLIDMDVQGEELNIVRSAVDEITGKVARLHIGTHAHDIEEGLRQTLQRLGWQCLADFPCCGTTDTPWGAVTFVDGVQSWRNPRLSRTT